MALDANRYQKASNDANRFLTMLDGVATVRDLLKDVAGIVSAAQEAEAKLAQAKLDIVAADRQIDLAKREAEALRAQLAAERDQTDAFKIGAEREAKAREKAFEDSKGTYEQELAKRTEAVRDREDAVKVREADAEHNAKALREALDDVSQREAALAAKEAKIKEALS